MFAALFAVALTASPAVVEDSAPKNFLVSGFALAGLGTTTALLSGAAIALTTGCHGDVCSQSPNGLFVGLIIAGVAVLVLAGLPSVFEGFRELIQASSRGPG